jgi:hypothetical protein
MRKLNLLIFTVLFFQFVFVQMLSSNTVGYISPVPNSKYNTENTNIIIGYSEKINRSTFKTTQIKVFGNISGNHSYELIFVESDKRIIIKPERPFAAGEKVTVSGINNLNDFSFFVRSKVLIWPDDCDRKLVLSDPVYSSFYNRDFMNTSDSLPAFVIYNSGSTADGKLFIANFSNSFVTGTMMILENSGAPVYSNTLVARAYDFKKQNNNLLTYYDELKHFFKGLDASYNVVDSFRCGNGYTTDLHELRVLPDGSAWLMSYDAQLVDMSVIVPGGKSNAIVTGLIIQKINAQKNVVFQWRSWDHFQITDATHEILTDQNIDYVHGNAIEIDTDSNIMISSRHMDEITKINSTTGAIIWRLGGKNNQFAFLNDTIGFSHQHYIRRLPNEHIILFDNGNYHTPAFSRVIEYTIDESSKQVSIYWQYRHSPNIYAFAMGSAQRLSNGNTMIGWGSASTTLTEVKPDGTVAYELSLPAGQMSYRAYRDEWGTLTGVEPKKNVSSEYRLSQNYPNPFNPNTNIRYKISKNSFVTLKVYDMLGREIETLVNEFQKAGEYEKQFSINLNSGRAISSGIYFYRLQADNFTDVKRMVLIK